MNDKYYGGRHDKDLDAELTQRHPLGDADNEEYGQLSEDMKAIVEKEPQVPEGPRHFTVNGSNKEISQPNRFRIGPRRTLTEREADLVIEARLYLAGKNHFQIAEELSKTRGYVIKRTQVSNDIHEIYKRWQVSYLTDINRLKVKELAKVDQIEAEYWNAWEASKQDKLGLEQIKTEDQIPGGAADLRTSYKRTKTTTKKERRDPNFMFLQGVQWCVEQRCKIFGLNAPATLNINWRKQAEDAGISDPEKYVDGLTDEFIRLAQSPRGLEGSGLPGGLGEGSETPETD